MNALIYGSAIALAIASAGVLADPPGKEAREAQKEQMEYERKQAKRDREWEREQRKRYEELAREERKHQEEIAREERKRLKEMERERGYTLEQSTNENGDDSSEPEYVEDKMYRVVKILRDLKDVVAQ
jgi:hypothetical protein